METTSITVVSDVKYIGTLRGITKEIEARFPFYCIDMTTRVEMEPGSYRDCVVPREGPPLVEKRCVLPWSPSAHRMFSNRGAATVKVLLSAIATILLVLVFILDAGLGSDSTSTKSNAKLGVFLSGALLHTVINLLDFSMYRLSIVRAVVRRFDFWYLSGMFLIEAAGLAYLFYIYGIHVAAACVGMASIGLTFPLTVLLIDASPRSKQGRSLIMVMWFVTHLGILIVVGLSNLVFDSSRINNFITFQLDAYVFKATPQSSVVMSSGTLLFFFLRYTVSMLRGSEYVMLYFEVKSAQEDIGIVAEKAPTARPPLLHLSQHRASVQNTGTMIQVEPPAAADEQTGDQVSQTPSTEPREAALATSGHLEAERSPAENDNGLPDRLAQRRSSFAKINLRKSCERRFTNYNVVKEEQENQNRRLPQRRLGLGLQDSRSGPTSPMLTASSLDASSSSQAANFSQSRDHLEILTPPRGSVTDKSSNSNRRVVLPSPAAVAMSAPPRDLHVHGDRTDDMVMVDYSSHSFGSSNENTPRR
jgi:hypothetical protein